MIMYGALLVYLVNVGIDLFVDEENLISVTNLNITFFTSASYNIICYGCLKVYQLIAQKTKLKKSNAKYISIDYKGNLARINSAEIILIEAYGNYIKIYINNEELTAPNKPIVVRQTLKNITELLNDNEIINLEKCHRSYIINTDKIVSINKYSDGKNYLNMEYLDIKVPVTKNKIEYLKELLSDSETIKF